MTEFAVYCAGPDVFAPDAKARAKHKECVLDQLGLVPLVPVDGAVENTSLGSHHIFRKNIDLMQRANLCIADITPFRGPNVDDGTAFEIGGFFMMRKPVFAYGDEVNDEYRVRAVHSERVQVDGLGWTVEDFGHTCNLMIHWGVQAICETFEEAAVRAAQWARREEFRS